MSKNKILNYIGLSKRAGYSVSGTELVEKALKKDQLWILFLANNLSTSQLKEFVENSKEKKVTIINEFSEDDISNAFGSARKVVGITNKGMAEKINNLMEEING